MSLPFNSSYTTSIMQTKAWLKPDMAICQQDYPLDWYQPEFIPYAEEYQALKDRKYETVVRWMKSYIEPALDYFGNDLLLLAHYYMGGEIVKLVEQFGGQIGDSYQLALKARENSDKKIIVESAVHFMAESISILAHKQQTVYITNPKSGCTMELLAKDYMVEPALAELNNRYGMDNILPVCYMNTSGRVKALVGAQGGAVCTSSNVKKIVHWAVNKNKKIVFIPDQYMGENVAHWLNIKRDALAYWPAGVDSLHFNLDDQDLATKQHFDQAQMILFASGCSVHSYFQKEMVSFWQQQNYHVVVHPECRFEVLNCADSYGSTAFIWDQVYNDRAGTKHYAIATENHMVENLKQACAHKGISVVNVGAANINGKPTMGCGCATMSRNDPPHLVAVLDLLKQGKSLDHNIVQPGDKVDERSGARERLSEQEQQWVVTNAGLALEKMMELTENS